ncbi:hypothetical protein HFP15_28830 [Amycolatopsis sp. K13G38]|uniref:DUF3558 domain-containing protein n=1 Tax=Amycolatopsis acididurans TaxID=2724524 RepID=A0ABX1JBM0_9PSEU|nr:hypothetical protein [Amycolatopsis acididurans]NKQ56884.1 hypothetical protein [Amycolatopsis acididurans]
MKIRHRAGGVLLAATALVTSACATVVAGTPLPPSAPPGPAVHLTQQVAAAAPKTYEGVPTYDPCAILTIDLVRQAGYLLDPANEYHDDRFTANGDKGNPQHPIGSPDPAGECDIWPRNSANFVSLQINQLPFQDTDDRDTVTRVNDPARLGANLVKDDNRDGMRVVTSTVDQPGRYQVTYFLGDYWAVLLVYAGGADGLTKSPEEILGFLTDQVAAKLRAGPGAAGQSEFGFGGAYAFAPTACSIYHGEDFPASFNEPEIGRVEEAFQLGERTLTADPVDAGQHLGPWQYARSSCTRANHAAVDFTGTAQKLTVQLESYSDEAGAAYSNTWSCSGDPKYKAPYGAPLTLQNKIGDGHVCFVKMGEFNPDFQFKVGRHVVTIHSFAASTYQNLDTSAAVLEKVSEQIAQRLTQYK